MGKPNQSCPTLRVHKKEMLDVACEKYLGDEVHKSATNKSNVEDRTAKGFGIVNHILAMVKEVPLGWRRVKAGLILRQAMLINGILFNTEAWHGVKKSDIEAFEKIDESLLRGLVKGHSKGPLAALYGDLGQIPIRFIWASRSILYLQTLLKRDSEELTNKVLTAQEKNPLKGDFSEIVEGFKENLEPNLTNEEIKSLSKNKLKKIIKSKTKEAALKSIIQLEGNKETGKMCHIKYNKLTTMKYLESPLFTQDESSLLLRLRTRCVNSIRNDFGGMYLDKKFPVNINCKTLYTLQHLLMCKTVQESINTPIIATHKSIYEDLFSEDIFRQK
jgi:hypothetical protein